MVLFFRGSLAFIIFFQLYGFAFPQSPKRSIENFDTSLFCNKRIIAIGEATHGSHQEQVFKSDLIKTLVQKKEYNTIILEASYYAVLPLNRYIQSDSISDIRSEMINDYRLSWIWKTDEYVELLDWLKLYNMTSVKKVKVIGIDVDANSTRERDSLMAVNVKQFLDGDIGIKAILLAHNGHVAYNERYNNAPSMGVHLKNMFGQDYFTIGQLFGRGSFNIFVTSNIALDTSCVTRNINKLAKGLGKNEKETILLTNGNKFLDKTINTWGYGATVPNIGYEYVRKLNPTLHFDAIVYHESICSASNLMSNGNYFTFSVHEILVDQSIGAGDTITFKMNYNTTSKSLVEVQLYKDNVFYRSVTDTLLFGNNSLIRKIGLNKDINRIRVNVFLFSNGVLTVQNNSVVCNESELISNNVFEESNNKKMATAVSSKLELILYYDDNRFRMLRKNRFNH